MNLIGISGKIGTGKDTIAQMIQELTAIGRSSNGGYRSEWEIKKYAAKLKQVASLLTGIPAEKFEDQEFKKTELSHEWCYPTEFTVYGDYTAMRESGYKPMTVREFLQKLGTEGIRDGVHKNAWVNALFADYKAALTKENLKAAIGNAFWEKETGIHQELKYPKWLITDVRFPNEAQGIKDRGGIVIRVNRDMWETHTDVFGVSTTIKLGPMDMHPSEIALDDWEFDYIIENNGSKEELLVGVKEMLQHYEII